MTYVRKKERKENDMLERRKEKKMTYVRKKNRKICKPLPFRRSSEKHKTLTSAAIALTTWQRIA